MMPNADAIALGKQIKAVRKAMKMTQEQLALKSNVSVKYIANIENAKNAVGCHKVTRNPFDRTFRTEQKHLSCQSGRYASLWRSFV